jgi:curved DNA-binding protein CbpA
VWWSVLGVSPQANADEIRCAYHRKIKQCHPDRVAGLAPEFIELAERHTRALNAAYDEATRAHRASS